jgi:hypothetical protein
LQFPTLSLVLMQNGASVRELDALSLTDHAPAMIDGDGRDGDSGADALGRAWGDLAG